MDGKLFVIDVMPFLYRGHFAFLKSPRMTASGINTSALHGLAASLAQILSEHQPTHIAFAFDSTTPTFRHEAFPAYKAQREKMPEDLAASIPMAFELAEAMRIRAIRIDGFEADDILGTLSAVASAAGLQTFLATPDKDAAQLVDSNTSLFRPAKGATPPEIFGEAEVRSHWGVPTPARVIDLLSMEGDASDNIPGIPGVGEKTALTLLQKYGSLDAVLAHASEISGKLGEKVAAGAESARQSYFLATIRRDAPVGVSLDDLVRREPDSEALAKFVAKYELVKVGRRLGLSEDAEAVAAVRDAESAPLATIATSPHEYICADTAEARAALEAELAAAPLYAVDTETTGLDPWKARIVGASFCATPGKAWYLPVPPPTDADGNAAALDFLRRVLGDASKTRVGHNLKYDLTVFRANGVPVAGRIHDTLLEHYALDAGERHGIDFLAKQYFQYEKIPTERLLGPRGKDQKNMADLDPREISDYACEDADFALRLHQRLYPEAESAGLLRVLSESEEPLVETLIEMEAEGVRIDPAALRAFGDELDAELRALEERFQKYAAEATGQSFVPSDDLFAAVTPKAEPVNIASPRQLGELLFDRMKLDSSARKTPSGQYATDEDTLQKLADRHPIIGVILEYRACSKLKSTYSDKLPTFIDPATGRVHTNFSQALTETGRLSSYDPNLQNIPVRTARGKRVRAAFVPRDAGHVLVSADYSQIELRVMAAMSGDAGLREAFARGADIHTETASRVYGVPAAQVTPEMRSRCKMVNFGIIYGISAFGLSQRLDIPRRQAMELIENYFKQYPGVKAYMDRAIAAAREKGYAETMLGRRRSLRDISSRNATARQAAERNAINTPVQGTAADLIKLAMVRARAALSASGLRAKMVLQVHDELLFDVPREEVEAVKPLIREAMVGALDIGVPLDVDIGVGDDWLEAH